MRKIIVFSRENITNYGDPIIADCAKYILEQVAAEDGRSVEVSIVDVYTKNVDWLQRKLDCADALVFPGGGMNSVKFNKRVAGILDRVSCRNDIDVYFNAIGINRLRADRNNEKLLIDLFSRPQVRQVTTRGDLNRLCSHLIRWDKSYLGAPTLVIDPAIWANNAYGISKAESNTVGLGLIRPEIFEANDGALSVDDVALMYKGLIAEMDRRGIEWQFFTNGMEKDYSFGLLLVEELGLDKDRYLGENVKDSRGLIERIASYKAVIASRMHANIIATSLDVPSIGLVWNDKMNLFAETVGCQDRYVSGHDLLNSSLVIDKLEQALAEGYDAEQIENMKQLTIKTLRNIVYRPLTLQERIRRAKKLVRRTASQAKKKLLPGAKKPA